MKVLLYTALGLFIAGVSGLTGLYLAVHYAGFLFE